MKELVVVVEQVELVLQELLQVDLVVMVQQIL